MSEYFVTVFGDDRYNQYKIKDILANSFNGLVNEEYSFAGVRYCFPIIVEDDRYYIVNNNLDWEFAVNGEALNGKKELSSGDYILAVNGESALAMLIEAYESCSLSAKLYELNKNMTYFIGRSPEMNVVIDSSATISRKHASIRIDEARMAYVDDLSGKTGVYVNHRKVITKKLKHGDHIFIMGNTFVYFDNELLVPANLKVNGIEPKSRIEILPPESERQRAQFTRTPRIQKTLERGMIEIDLPPAPQKQKEVPFLLIAGPSLTMAVAMLASTGVTLANALNGGNYTSIITSSVMAVSMLLGALLWPKLTRNYNAKVTRENEEYRQSRYREYLQKKNQEIASVYDRNTRIWNESLFPNVKELLNIVSSQDYRLWERSVRDGDFMEIRLGLGERPFEMNVAIRKKEFELEEDILRNEGYEIAEKYTVLKNVPITLSLKEHRVVGVVGDYVELAQAIIMNLVTLYAPDEVKIVLVYNKAREEALYMFHDLPHMWAADQSERYVATSTIEAHVLFENIDERIQSRAQFSDENRQKIPYYVILVFDQLLVENIPFWKNLVNVENTIGLSAVFFGKRFHQIPKECETIIQKNEEMCGLYIRNENNNRLVEFKSDEISDEDVKILAEGLARIEVKKERVSSDMPDRISFLDLYQVGNIESLHIASHWNTNGSDRTLAAPIGIIAGGERFYLDVHEKYHGCHGLVAGTTGSGKSEFLQAYILSMMINYSPNEVSFVLVDFKGGDMARPFLKSPHLAATISNLSGNTLYRALVSLEAEVKNRQGVFNESAAVLGIDKIDINSYHKYFKEGRLRRPLPHLIIIIDEFAQLKTQHPEFMEKLIDVAQVGRSLGIHLILATQKPSGVVDPQIWSNSRFRVCLKVMDKQDSSDMIHRPIAAMIKNPGRAYVQVGYDEIFELMQSGYSGAGYAPRDVFVNEDDITVRLVNWPGEELRTAKDAAHREKTNLTQLEAVMNEIVRVGEEFKIYARKLWLAPLPSQLRLEKLEDVPADDSYGVVTCGLLDLPHIQKQLNYSVDFMRDGHLAIYGSAGTGKSTMIQTIFYGMAKKYSPEKFQSVVMDFNGGSLENLSRTAHCISYVTDESEAKVSSLLNMIGQMIADRRELFHRENCSNFESYVKAGNFGIPILLVAIDNYSSFREKMYKCEDLLVQYIAAARSSGIYFIITGNSKGAVYYKITDHIGNRVVFQMNDTESYRDILNTSIPMLPENVKGRALVVHEKIAAEMQVGVPFDEKSETLRMYQINAFYAEQVSEYGKAEQYRSFGETNITVEEEELEAPVYKKQSMKRIHGVNMDESLFDVAKADTGEKTGIFRMMDKHAVFVANPEENEDVVYKLYQQLRTKGHSVSVYSKKRTDLIGSYIENIDEFVEQYESLETALLIDGFTDFYDAISDDALEKFTEIVKNSRHKLIVTVDSMKTLNMYCDTELYLILVKCDTGLFMGGKATNQRAVLLNSGFYSIAEEDRNIALRQGEAIAYESDAAEYIAF